MGKVTVWAGIFGSEIIGPFFCANENVNGENYLELLEDCVIPALEASANG